VWLSRYDGRKVGGLALSKDRAIDAAHRALERLSGLSFAELRDR
jgi:hypothetical protein